MNKKQLFFLILSWVFLSIFPPLMLYSPNIKLCIEYFHIFFSLFIVLGIGFFIPLLYDAFKNNAFKFEG